jgi:hypothetical protein
MDFHQSSTLGECRLAVPVRASRLGGRDARGPSKKVASATQAGKPGSFPLALLLFSLRHSFVSLILNS